MTEENFKYKQQHFYLNENIILELKAIAREERESMSKIAENALMDLIKRRRKRKTRIEEIADLARSQNG